MRYLLAIGLVAIIIGALVGIKFKQISGLIKHGEAGQKAGPPPESIGTTVARQDTWEGTLTAVGSIAAAKGVTVSNESPGVVSAIHFESGDYVKAGQILVELDTSVERAQLASAEARRELANVSADRSRKLVASAAISNAQLDNDEAQLKTSKADFTALKAQIDRKSVRAPFSGRLGIRTVNLGQYLNPGTAISVLESLGSVYVDFSLPQQALPDAPVRTPVRVTLAGSTAADKGAFDGVIAAVDPTVDSATRTIKLRASVPNKGDKLRPGMYVNVAVVLAQRNTVVTAPATSVVHASYGDSVFVVQDKKSPEGTVVTGPDGKPAKVARQQFVRVGLARGDFIALLDGVKPGQELVSAGAFKLRNGSGVIIHNEIAPVPSLTPTPDNH